MGYHHITKVRYSVIQVNSLPDLYAQLGGLWTYLTEWASLRLPDNPNSARRTVYPLWATVQGVAAQRRLSAVFRVGQILRGDAQNCRSVCV
jgi:hypothetical protein